MKLLKKTAVGQRRVYDIEVEDVHNFYANGINVHNCATAGGVSVIKDDGTVVNGDTNKSIWKIGFDSRSLFWTTNTVGYWAMYTELDRLTNGLSISPYENSIFATSQGNTGYPKIPAGGAIDELISDGETGLIAGDKTVGLSRLTTGDGYRNTTFRPDRMLLRTTSSFTSGWMNGDIKGAFLSSTDTASLVGSGELVTNGTFDTDTSGWTAANSTLSIAANKLQVVSSGAGIAYAEQTLSGLTVGQTYILEATGSIISGSSKAYATIYTGTGTFVANAISNVSAETTGTLTFVASQTSMKVRLQLLTPTGSGDTGLFDNISVKLADADRSANNKGLIVNGTVTRSAVATGAELVAYSGFSASNYLEQPYNSALDFGTGDFCVMGWVKGATVTDRQCPIVFKSDGFDCRINFSTGFPSFWDGTTRLSGSINLANSPWTQLIFVRKSGVGYIYVNGLLNVSGALAADVNATNPMRVGSDASIGYFQAGSLALLRISATAPTPDQIKKIYEDEKVLFQENAACTLYGTSDAVTALAHDSDTGLLHVGTSAGRSVFQGLRRVSNTTTAVGTAISAANGLVAEE